MTLAIGFITPGNLSYVAIQLDRLAWLIVALATAILGLSLDVALGLAPLGWVALLPATVGLGITTAVLILEVRDNESD